jgi:DNA sulfur modification protein DndE
MLAQRTGLRPNLSCRLGFCLSLEEFGVPSADEFGGKGDREFNWSTLFGQWDLFFVALLKQRLIQDGLDPEADLDQQLQLHLNRGVFLLFKRMRQLEDLGPLLERTVPLSVPGGRDEQL